MRYFWGLDLIRFLSAVLVVLFHVYAFGGETPIWPADANIAPLSWLQPVAWMGWIGVQIFFVISGFVIAASAQASLAGTFLKKRAIRLLPALWISASLALLARALWGEPVGELLPSFLRTLVLAPKGPYIDGVVWTLVVEAAFYLSTAVVIFFSASFGGNERALYRFALLLGATSAAFTVFYWAVETMQNVPIAGAIVPYVNSFVFDITLFRQGVFFALGMLLYQVVNRGMARQDMLLIFALSLACALQIFNNVGALIPALKPIAIWAIATGLIYSGALYGDRLIKRDLRPIMRPVGLMTYPLYLNHFILGQALLPILATRITNSAVLFLVLFSILLANAWLIAQYPERWVQKKLRQTLLGGAGGLRSARPPAAGPLIARPSMGDERSLP